MIAEKIREIMTEMMKNNGREDKGDNDRDDEE